jgi:DNA-binding response OmpR family regulator
MFLQVHLLLYSSFLSYLHNDLHIYAIMLYGYIDRMKEVKKALIIDDELDICMLLKGFLNRKNKHVDYSTSLKCGLEKFEEGQPDLLLLDHNLPDGRGIDHIREFKKKKKGASSFIVVMSAMTNLRQTALENGADYFIGKPITFGKLNEILTRNKESQS